MSDHQRDGAGWRLEELRDPGARIVIPDIGPLGDLYRYTPLASKID